LFLNHKEHKEREGQYLLQISAKNPSAAVSFVIFVPFVVRYLIPQRALRLPLGGLSVLHSTWF